MRKKLLRIPTGLLLATAILWGGLVPPGYRHAHAGGDVPHEHPVSHHHHHHGHAGHQHHGHAGHHHHHHGDHQHHKHKAQAELTTTPVPHIHLACLLFDLTLPVSEPTGSEGEGCDQGLCIVRLFDECVPPPDRGPDFRLDHRSTPLPCSPMAPATATRRASGPPGTGVLLSDNARHERSGVQLF